LITFHCDWKISLHWVHWLKLVKRGDAHRVSCLVHFTGFLILLVVFLQGVLISIFLALTWSWLYYSSKFGSWPLYSRILYQSKYWLFLHSIYVFVVELLLSIRKILTTFFFKAFTFSLQYWTVFLNISSKIKTNLGFDQM